MKKKALKAAFPYTIPIGIGFLFLGMSYGFMMQSKGFSVWYPFFYEYVYLCRFYGICDSQSSVVGIQSDRGIFSGSGSQCQTFILWTFHAG